MKKLLLCTLVAAFSIPVFSLAASFDCAKAVLTAEKLICDNETLSKLDDQLANLYRKSLVSVIDTSVLKKEQMKWLKDTRDKCIDPDCLEHAYKERSTTLEGYGDWKIKERSENICETVIGYINDGTLTDRFEKFLSPTESEIKLFQEKNGVDRYLSGKYTYQNGDSKKVFLDEYLPGSCTRGFIEEERGEAYSGESAIAKIPYDIDEEDKADKEGWGSSEFLLKINNDLIKVVGNYRSSSFDAKAVYAIDSLGSFQKQCSLGHTGNIKYILKEGLNLNLCEKVAENKVGVKEWRSDFSNFDSHSLFGEGEVMSAKVDLNDDGKNEIIGLQTYQLSAGCGGTVQQVRELSADGKLIVPTILNANLEQGYGRFSSWGAYMGSSPNDWWFSVKIVEFDGKAYLMGTSEKNSISIYSFWKNERKMWCDFKLLPQHKVTKLYIQRKSEK